MAGSKKKGKKAPPPKNLSPPPAVMDDDELMDDLLAELDSRDTKVQAESAQILNEIQTQQLESDTKKTAKDKFQARQARKATLIQQTYTQDDPEADARLQKEAENEDKAIRHICDKLNLEIYEINPDGHCLFSAIADQLNLLSILPASQTNYATVRHAASNYIYSHPSDFLPFLPCSEGEDGAGASDAGLMTPAQFEKYCVTIRDTGAWGGEPEILALSRAFNIPIHIIQGGSPPIVVHNPSRGPGPIAQDNRAVRISYHRRLYGLGEHYNSLRPKSKLSRITETIQSVVN